MAKKKPFSEALLELVKANPGEIFTLTPEQLAERTGYSIDEARDYYQGIAAEKRRRAEQEEEVRIRDSEADVITYIPSSQHVRIMYYPHLGEVKIESTYQRKRKYAQKTERWGNEEDSVLLSAQDSIEIGIYLSGLQPHIRDTQARIASKPDPTEPELPETYLPLLTPPDRMRLSDFARMHGISATEAVKYFDRHLIAGERERNSFSYSGKTVDSVFIYSQGKRDAWQHLHDLPGFHRCPQCPHEVEEENEEQANTHSDVQDLEP
ncbi:MAG: hypothetical protein ACRDIV_17760 [Ktedonobacteraceae bacterium]